MQTCSDCLLPVSADCHCQQTLNNLTPNDWDKAAINPFSDDYVERPKTSPHPDNNPKTRVGALKAPLHLVPPSAEIALAEALADGASKYGAYNWREETISVSVYVGAIRRHLGAFLDGEDIAEDSGVHHLAHAMACCALMIDAKSIGMLNDDRPTVGASPALLEEYKVRQEKRNE